jgi:hypothetical protein
MSIRSVVTRGYGQGGSIALAVLRGYGAEAVADVVALDADTHDGFNWDTRRQDQALAARRKREADSLEELKRAIRRGFGEEPEFVPAPDAVMAETAELLPPVDPRVAMVQSIIAARLEAQRDDDEAIALLLLVA